MALIINHNLSAMIAARFLGQAYDKLSKSIERLSSGLRINSAADDAAGLAIREMMRADIAANLQGIRNAADGISLIQTAEGAMAVIDEKLIRMKELAEQAATGTYTSVQREIINSEYQAMAADIDRIANATNFNGVKLLDGSMNLLNSGQGLRIHFGATNTPDDYYYIQTENVRATDPMGLKIGGDATIDIWATGSYRDIPGTCCVGGIANLNANAGGNRQMAFSYAYNYDSGNTTTASDFYNSRYLAGRYALENGDTTYQDVINNINKGTQSRVIVNVTGDLSNLGVNDYYALCLGNDEVFYFGVNATAVTTGKSVARSISTNSASATGIAKAINSVTNSNYWAYASGTAVVIFRKDGGDNNSVIIEENTNSTATNINNFTTFRNAETGATNNSSMNFSLGGEHWGTMEANEDTNGYSLVLLGQDVGDNRDLYIVGGATTADTTFQNKLISANITAANQYITGMKGADFTEIQDASNAPWAGGEIRTQESAQRALDAVTQAITRKDIIRANLGTSQNRLESIINNLTIQVENLQASESRISDVDVATEMTEFTKNNILAQAATAMLAQANSLGALALTLIEG
jgi:flagellin